MYQLLQYVEFYIHSVWILLIHAVPPPTADDIFFTMATRVAGSATGARFVSRTATTSSRWLFTNGMTKGISPLFSTNSSRWFSSYPPHEVVGMPSLSPVRFQDLAASSAVCVATGLLLIASIGGDSLYSICSRVSCQSFRMPYLY